MNFKKIIIFLLVLIPTSFSYAFSISPIGPGNVTTGPLPTITDSFEMTQEIVDLCDSVYGGPGTWFLNYNIYTSDVGSLGYTDILVASKYNPVASTTYTFDTSLPLDAELQIPFPVNGFVDYRFGSTTENYAGFWYCYNNGFGNYQYVEALKMNTFTAIGGPPTFLEATGEPFYIEAFQESTTTPTIIIPDYTGYLGLITGAILIFLFVALILFVRYSSKQYL